MSNHDLRMAVLKALLPPAPLRSHGPPMSLTALAHTIYGREPGRGTELAVLASVVNTLHDEGLVHLEGSRRAVMDGRGLWTEPYLEVHLSQKGDAHLVEHHGFSLLHSVGDALQEVLWRGDNPHDCPIPESYKVVEGVVHLRVMHGLHHRRAFTIPRSILATALVASQRFSGDWLSPLIFLEVLSGAGLRERVHLSPHQVFEGFPPGTWIALLDEPTGGYAPWPTVVDETALMTLHKMLLEQAEGRVTQARADLADAEARLSLVKSHASIL